MSRTLLRAFLVLRLESADVRWTCAAVWEYLLNRPKAVTVMQVTPRPSRPDLRLRIRVMYPF